MRSSSITTAVMALVVLLHVWSCNEQPVSEAPEATQVTANTIDAPSLEALRAMARRSPQEALNALEARSDAAEGAGIAEIRILAQTSLFNDALKQLALESDLRHAVTVTLELAERPTPINKRRLAQPVWGLIGKLEQRLESDPAFAQAAAKRLAGSSTLVALVGPQLRQRLDTILRRAEHLEITAQVDALLSSKSFGAIVTQLDSWSKQPEKVTVTQLIDAIGQVIEALERRSERGVDSRLRADALALFTYSTQLKTSHPGDALDTSHARIAQLMTRAGAPTMERWLKTIRRSAKAPVDVARHGCEASRFVQTEPEKQALTKALEPARSTLEERAKEAALRYLNAIETRRFKAWRTMEQPFLGAAEGAIDEFADQRERWLAANPRLDPRTAALHIAAAEFDLCKVSLALNLSRGDTTPVEVALTMCWHAERGAWFPCRPLTRATKDAMVRP